jgi:flavodoxin
MPVVRIVYVSRTGHSRALAQEVAAQLGETACEIIDKVDRRGLIGYLRSGRQAMRKMATPIGDPGVDLAGAGAVILVQPIWASAVVPPLRSWLQAHKQDLAGKKLGLLASNMGSPAARLKMNFEQEFGPLVAFGVIPQRSSPEAKSKAVAVFLKSLHRKE